MQAARNEFESFQVVVNPGSAPATITDLTITALTGPGNPITGNNITIYRAGEYTVTIATDLEGATGRWFDALIPRIDPIYRELRNAFPFVVQANENANFWVDIFVPAGQARGIYSGNLSVNSSAGNVSIPVRLEVLNFGLPSTTSLASLFAMGGFRQPCVAFTDNGSNTCNGNRDQEWALSSMLGRVALENRVTLANPWPLGNTDVPPTAGMGRELWNRYALPLINGTDVTPASGTWFPNRLSGARMTSVTLFGNGAGTPGFFACEGACVSAWKNEALAQGFSDRLIYYACDELRPENPSCPDWSTFIRRAQAANAAPPAGVVRNLITKDIDGANANGATSLIDTIVPTIRNLHERPGKPLAGDQSSKYRAPGAPRNFWSYTACGSFGCGNGTSPDTNGWPGYAIDAPAAQHRAMGWLAFRYGFTGELYYSVAHKLATAWTDQYDFGVHGDGNLFYPGLTAQDNPGKCATGTTNKACIGGTHQIPIESIRLKRIRDGREDYEFLIYLDTLEKRLGLASQAASITFALFPTAYSVTVDKDGGPSTAGSLEAARARLIQRIKDIQPLGRRRTVRR